MNDGLYTLDIDSMGFPEMGVYSNAFFSEEDDPTDSDECVKQPKTI